MAFEAIMNGALGDRALPGAHGRINVLWFVLDAELGVNVKQRMFSSICL